MSNEDPISQSFFEDYGDFDDEETIEILDLFFTDTTEQLRSIYAALAKKDVAAVEFEAHSIKGAAQYMHAEPMSACALRAETAAKERDISNLPFIVDELHDAYLRVAEFFERADAKGIADIPWAKRATHSNA